MKRIKLDASLVLLVLAVLFWLVAGVGGVAEFAFPRTIYTCEFTVSGHRDNDESGPDIYYVTLADKNARIRTLRIDAEDYYSIGPNVPVTIETTRSRYLGIPLSYNIYITQKDQPHYDECAEGKSLPSGGTKQDG